VTTASFLFTASALICSLLTLVSVLAAYRAQRSEESLRRSVGRISALEFETATLASQIHKLRQKIYSTKAPPAASEIADAPNTFPACENWLRAQTEGPSSQAAKCACDYCIAQRNNREAVRAKLVPKTATEIRSHVEKARRT